MEVPILKICLWFPVYYKPLGQWGFAKLGFSLGFRVLYRLGFVFVPYVQFPLNLFRLDGCSQEGIFKQQRTLINLYRYHGEK